MVALLLAAIVALELQGMDARERAHRERTEQTLAVKRVERKLDWLLLTTPPPTSSAPAPLPPAASAPGR